MAETNSGNRVSILVPALITVAVTVLRLVGELQHWSPTLFRSSAGGGGAIVGITWLVFIFGIYFALKLAGAGQRPASVGKAIGFAVLGLIMVIGGTILTVAPKPVFPGKPLLGILIAIAGGALQFSAWPALAKTLLAYGYAARIPVAIVMFFAIRGSWGTHYDVLPPGYTGPTSFWGEYALIGLVPQLVFWVAFTIAAGSLFGSIAVAIARRGRPAVAATASS